MVHKMTMKLFQARFSPYMFKNSKSALNRVLVPPMASETADGEGCVTGETLAHYQKIAESGAGIVMGDYTFVDPSGKSEGRQLGISTQNHVQGLSQLAQAIKASGALAGIQLTHSGGKSTQVLTQGLLMAPSSIPTPIKDRVPETPKEMTDEDIQLWKESFLAGASRAVIAVGGFQSIDFIEHTLQNSLVQFVAVGRAILADPRGWKESVMLQGNSVSHSNCPQVLFNSGVCEIH